MKNATNISKIHKINYIQRMDKVHIYMCLHIASIISTAGNKTRLLLKTKKVLRLFLKKGTKKVHFGRSVPERPRGRL